MMEGVDEGVDRRVGVTDPEDVEIKLRRSGEFLGMDRFRITEEVIRCICIP